MPEKSIINETNIFLIKVILPAFLAVGIKIAIEMKKNKIRTSWLNVILSLLIGVGGAYISSDLILETFDVKYISVMIALVAIISDKIGEFLIFKFNVDGFLTAFVDVILTGLKKKE